MRPASFDIEAVTENGLLRITMVGFFAAVDIEAFLSRLILPLAKLGCRANEHVTLCDIRGMQIQSQDSVELFRRLLWSDPVRSRRLAFVVSATLARMQARRPADRPQVEFFDTVEKAEEWLGHISIS